LGGPKAEAERKRGLGRRAKARPNLWHFVSPKDQAQERGDHSHEPGPFGNWRKALLGLM